MSVLEWYDRDPSYAHVQLERRSVGSLGFTLVDGMQPAGSYVLPGNTDFNLQVLRKRVPRARVDHGTVFTTGAGGNLALAPVRTPLRYDVDGDTTCTSAIMPVEAVATVLSDATGRDWAGDFGGLHTRMFADAAVEALLHRIWAEAAAGSPHGTLFADHAWTTVCLALHMASNRETGCAPPRSGGLAPWQVRRVTDRLMADLSDDPGLAELARLVGLSAHHFCRAFKVSTGLPPHRWRLQRRIERARELLDGTDLSVSGVAAAVGYEDPSQLAAVFRKSIGVSPTQYRRGRRT